MISSRELYMIDYRIVLVPSPEIIATIFKNRTRTKCGLSPLSIYYTVIVPPKIERYHAFSCLSSTIMVSCSSRARWTVCEYFFPAISHQASSIIKNPPTTTHVQFILETRETLETEKKILHDPLSLLHQTRRCTHQLQASRRGKRRRQWQMLTNRLK